MEELFYQPVKNDLKTYHNIQKIETRQGDDYKTGCLLDYFEKSYKIIAIDLSQQQKLDAAPKAMQQINFTGNLYEENVTMFFITKEAK